MIYREYGQTGKKVSLLGFGGMRFAAIDNQDECIRTMLTAAEGGVNYFDTAPGYFGTKSEEVFGKALAEFRRKKIPHYVATKTFESEASAIRGSVEAQLKRLDIPAIDFYHIWCITSLDDWHNRKKNNILTTFRKLKEEGLIKHICVSSHLTGSEIKELLMEGVFEGVLFGYSAYNFQTRQAAFDAIREKKLGAVVMNPLGGGVIPQNPEQFSYLCRPGESLVAAALRFLWDHKDITVTLQGGDTLEHVQEALAAMEGYQSRSEAELSELKNRVAGSTEGICTGCAYCDNCPHGIPIPKFMDTYNQKILGETAHKKTSHRTKGEDPFSDRLKYHWRVDRALAEKCTACGACEKACTQHLPIIERLKEIAAS